MHLALLKNGSNIAVTDSCNNEKREIVGSHVLLAVGRNANTHDLGLDKAGVKNQ